MILQEKSASFMSHWFLARGCKIDPIFSAQADKEKLEKLLERAKQEVLEMRIQSYHPNL